MTLPSPTTEQRPHGALVLALLALLGLALLVGFMALGVWQVERRSWKLALIERVTHSLHAPPQALPPANSWPGLDMASASYTPVHLQGHWLPAKTVLTQATTELGAGFWVLTPLQQADGSVVLVNRGFIPQEQRSHWQPDDTSAHTIAAVTGLLRASEPGGGFLRHNDPAAQRWYSRDVAAITQAQGLAGTPVAPFFVDAGIPSAAGAQPPQTSAGPWPRPGLTVVRFHNSHLSYALTWFTLAAMVAAAAVLVTRYELRLRRAHRPH